MFQPCAIKCPCAALICSPQLHLPRAVVCGRSSILINGFLAPLSPRSQRLHARLSERDLPSNLGVPETWAQQKIAALPANTSSSFDCSMFQLDLQTCSNPRLATGPSQLVPATCQGAAGPGRSVRAKTVRKLTGLATGMPKHRGCFISWEKVPLAGFEMHLSDLSPRKQVSVIWKMLASPGP